VYSPTLNGKDWRMAAAVVYGPALPSPGGRMSVSTSPRSSTTSSESPRTATTFSFSLRYMSRTSSPPDDDVVPKVEEIEDDDLIEAKTETPPGEADEGGLAEPSRSSSGLIARRPRGRPRKHPKTPPTSIAKPPKGRSKTGCITCRRRKKKCDETKPACMEPDIILFISIRLTVHRSSLPKEQCSLRRLSSKGLLAERQATSG
jgi:hypothetical protein